MKHITSAQIDEAGACDAQMILFEQIFPDGAEVTRENFEKAVNGGLNVHWVSAYLEDFEPDNEYHLENSNAHMAFMETTDRIQSAWDRVFHAAFEARRTLLETLPSYAWADIWNRFREVQAAVYIGKEEEVRPIYLAYEKQRYEMLWRLFERALARSA